MFENRQDAGRKLAERLKKLALKDIVVLGVPRGGVVVAAEVARQLNAPLDIIVAKKIGYPGEEEYAVGAVAKDVVVYDFAAKEVDAGWLKEKVEELKKRVLERYKEYSGGNTKLKDRTAVIVDDGMATGASMIACVRQAVKEGAKLVVVAVPVAPPEAVERVREEAHVECLTTPSDFFAVGQFYEDFGEVSDEEAKKHFGQR